jgi:5'-3' exonuclease
VYAIIDGSYFLHRTLHQNAYRGLRTSAGVFSGGVFGFLGTVGTALRDVSADRAICVWDGHKSERRLALYPEYKHKEHKPEPDGFDYMGSYRISRDAAFEVLPRLGVRTLCLPAREGDDTIYRVKRSIRNWRPNEKIVVLSADRDMNQLIDTMCAVYRPMTGEWVTSDNQDAQTGVCSAEEYLMWRALSGDSSDKITGIRGVGDSRAVELIHLARPHRLTYGKSLDEAIKLAAVARKTKWATAVVEGWDTVERNLQLMDLSKELVTKGEKRLVRSTVRAPCSLASPAVVTEFLDRYELRQLSSEYGRWSYPFTRLR